MSPAKPCDDAFRAGRVVKARGFMAAAEILETFLDDEGEIGEEYVTLCVHAGIAASDVICCARLGEYPRGENHREAIATLARADQHAANHLEALLSMKTRAGYGATHHVSHRPQARRARSASSPVRRRSRLTATSARPCTAVPARAGLLAPSAAAVIARRMTEVRA